MVVGYRDPRPPGWGCAVALGDAGDLAEHTLFLSDAAGSFHGLLQRYLQADGYHAHRLQSTGSVKGVKGGVAADPLALGLLPAHALAQELQSGAFVEIAVKRALPPIYLKGIWQRATRLPPQAAALAERMPSDGNLSELTDQCTQLCTGLLNAALENVHIIYVAVRHGRGHPAFAEIRYRLEPFRTKPVMDSFMDGLDEAIRQNTGLAARIRCFGYAAPAIHVRN